MPAPARHKFTANGNQFQTDEVVKAVTDFFESHTIEQCERDVWDLLIGYLDSDDNNPHNSNMAFFCKGLIGLLKTLNGNFKEMPDTD